ncbi:MAG: hypothetical protein IKI84_00060 [Clostridia bacterium]|nr:hypothetical protein [Clostridia bacterium]
MKKALSLLLAAVLILAVSPAPAAEKEWTVLVYICGSDLESENGQASDDIREMISSGIGSSPDVNVLIATGGSREWQGYGISGRTVQYFRIGSGGPELILDAGRRSMGDAATLSGFIRCGLSSAPARKTALVIWDHGGGPVFGLCNDENFDDDGLTLSELRLGLTDGLQGGKLDIAAFDCCLMNCVDLCADLVGVADYAVLSQELVTGTGFDYDAWMKPLIRDPGLSAEKAAVSMAETYVADNSKGRHTETATMSVIRTDRMPRVLTAADAFSASLSDLLRTNPAGVVRLRTKLLSFGEFIDEDASDLVDVEEMCDVFSALLPAECAELKAAAREAVAVNCATKDISGHANGLSFFFPYATVRWDRQDILAHYGSRDGAYAGLAVAMASQSSGYGMTASAYAPSEFYAYDEEAGSSGAFCDIWNGYFGGYASAGEISDTFGGNIWAGLDPSSGPVWQSIFSGGVWSGYPGASPTAAPVSGGIWAGLSQETPPPASQAASAPPAPEIANIWQGLLDPGAEYYQPGETNANVQPGVSDAVSAGDMMAEANAYFSTAVLSSQMIWSLQLNRDDLDHLSSACGVLSRKDGDEVVRLGDLGETTVDWSTGLVFSMFDGSWPTLEGQMVRAEFLYTDGDGNTRFVIPARVNGLKMYLLGIRAADGSCSVPGATQGYDENGLAIRGTIPLEAGMTVRPLFTALYPDGTGREFEGPAVTVPAEGLSLAWERIPAGDYLYCFALTDLEGNVHDTRSVPLSF